VLHAHAGVNLDLVEGVIAERHHLESRPHRMRPPSGLTVDKHRADPQRLSRSLRTRRDAARLFELDQPGPIEDACAGRLAPASCSSTRR
jgi:hypothetical protein